MRPFDFCGRLCCFKHYCGFLNSYFTGVEFHLHAGRIIILSVIHNRDAQILGSGLSAQITNVRSYLRSLWG